MSESDALAAAPSPDLHLVSPEKRPPPLPPSPSETSPSLTPEESTWFPHHADTPSPHEAQRHSSTGPPSDSSYISSRPQTVPQISDIAAPSPRYWPLSDENKVFLLRHFVAKLSLWVSIPPATHLPPTPSLFNTDRTQASLSPFHRKLTPS